MGLRQLGLEQEDRHHIGFPELDLVALVEQNEFQKDSAEWVLAGLDFELGQSLTVYF